MQATQVKTIKVEIELNPPIRYERTTLDNMGETAYVRYFTNFMLSMNPLLSARKIGKIELLKNATIDSKLSGIRVKVLIEVSSGSGLEEAVSKLSPTVSGSSALESDEKTGALVRAIKDEIGDALSDARAELNIHQTGLVRVIQVLEI